MIYQGEDDVAGYKLHTNGSPGVMRMGLARSSDGFDFDRYGKPVLYPQHDKYSSMEWSGGCEIPRLVESPDGTYVLLYDGWNKSTACLMVATSKDLVHWTKHGSPFAKNHGEQAVGQWSKSAAVITEIKDGKLLAAKINGKYWMYWGEQGLDVAVSDNLIDWKNLTDDKGNPIRLLPKREGMFDDGVIEGGVAVKTDKGIVIIYNSFLIREIPDPHKGHIKASGLAQALVDANDPTRLIDRADAPFLVADREYEVDGAVNNVVFTTGLALFNNKWYLYHNGGDRVMCVATSKY